VADRERGLAVSLERDRDARAPLVEPPGDRARASRDSFKLEALSPTVSVCPAIYNVIARNCLSLSLAKISPSLAYAASSFGTSLASMSLEAVRKFTSFMRDVHRPGRQLQADVAAVVAA